jgi:single-strand DNA-binding protein
MKGQQVYIEGRLQTRHWEDAEGNRHSSTEIVANEMIMLGDRRDGAVSAEEEVEEEDFPF